MKNIERIISIIIAAALTSTGNVFAYAAEKKNPAVNSIFFPNVNTEELDAEYLSENGKNKIVLCENGASDYTIVVPDACSNSLFEAAEILREVIKEMTDTVIPVLRESEKRESGRIICIDTALNAPRPDDNGIADGYRTVIGDSGIFICGVTEAGSRNGVYGFIEDVLGCMFLSPDDTFIPKHDTLYLEKTDTIVKPSTLWRDVYAYETVQNNWAAKLRLNGINVEADDPNLSIEELQYEQWGTWCHNCYQYLSPDDYFEEHPEYFSEKNGKRVTEYDGRDAYLCLSNPEVFEIVKNSLAQKIKENPEQLYWDFSGNDNSSLAGCECDKCKAADKAAGGTGMGTLLPFLNKLAKAFPDKYISSLAYLHTLKAPKGIKAEPNVVIKLCSMPGDQASSYLDGANANAKEFKTQVEEWSKITDKIVVWDYVVNFSHLLMPFPNFAVQAENQKFYENNNIIGIFHQASREKGGEFACLRAYVLSHLMWEGSNMDVAECVSKYITAYFGSSAPYIIEYMNLCASELYTSGKPLGLYDGLMNHYRGYLSPENIRKYEKLIADAKTAADDPISLSRLEEIELSVAYAASLQPEISEAARQAALNTVNEICDTKGITMVCEWESLESFNQSSLSNTVKAEKHGLRLPYYIGAGIGAAFAAIAAGAFVVLKRKRKRKQ